MRALAPLEPRIQIGGSGASSGIARKACIGWSAGSSFWPDQVSSSDSNCGNCSPSNARSARVACTSEPGARPRPRSMRSGCSAASVRKASATRSGAWLGSITPPEPTRSRVVAEATWPIRISGAALATAGMPWCSANQ